jgi:hypothetical protein
LDCPLRLAAHPLSDLPTFIPFMSTLVWTYPENGPYRTIIANLLPLYQNYHRLIIDIP